MDATESGTTASLDPLAELTESFAESATHLFAASSVADTLAVVAQLAKDTIEGCDFAGLFVLDGAEISTPAHTDQIVVEIDAIQQRTGEGPCLDAVSKGLVFYASDLVGDDRWPKFAPLAIAAGIRSALALPLLPAGRAGAVNLYARYPDAFGVVDRARGVLLASLSSLAIDAARAHEDEQHLISNLTSALATRELIGQAQGILMERERITPDEAFDVLRRASQHLNRKLRDVAHNLIDTGESPDTGAAKPPA